MKRNFWTKSLACVLTLAMVLSVGFTTVFAEYEQIQKEAGGVIYEDDFSDATTYPAFGESDDYINLKSKVTDGESYQIGTSDWYLECGTGNLLGSPVGYKVIRDAETGKSSIELKGETVSLGQYPDRRSSMVYKGDLSELTNTYRIKFSLSSKSVYTSVILKFAGENSDSYYRFATASKKDETGSALPVWQLDKFSNKSATTLLESDYTFKTSMGVSTTVEEQKVFSEYGALHSAPGYPLDVEVIVTDNSIITVKVSGPVYENNMIKESKTCVLPTPISVDACDQFIGFGAGSYTGQHFNISKFSIENYSDAGEQENDIYANVATKVDNEGVMELASATQIKRIANLGSESTTVLLSEDGETYKKLADIDGLESFSNDITAKAYKYIKLIGSQEIAVYAPITALKARSKSYPLAARIANEMVENAVFTSSNEKIAVVEDGRIIPLREGNVTITANDTVEAVVNVSALTNYTNFASYTEFENGEEETVLNAENKEDGVVLNDDWRYRFVDAEGKYTDTYSTMTKVALVEDKGIKLFNYPLGRDNSKAPILAMENLPAELGKDYKMTINFNKNSVMCGFGLRFMVHNDGKNYYLMHLAGGTETEYIYTFEKYVDGACVGSFNGPELNDANYGGKFASTDSKMVITYQDGKIGWEFNANRNEGSNETYTGEYIDEEPFDVKIEDTFLGFTNNANGATDGVGNRFLYIYNFAIAPLDPDTVTFIDDEVAGVYTSTFDSAKVYVAEYDADGRLIGIKSGDLKATYKKKTEDGVFKAFVLDAHDSLKPLCAPFNF